MLHNFKRIALAAGLAAATLVGAASPAQARERYRDRGDDAAIAVGAGIIGLAVGAAIASDRGDRYYRGRSYYGGYPGDYYYGAYPEYRGGYYRDYRRDYRREYRRAYRRDYRGGRYDNRGYYGGGRRYYRY